MVQVTNCGKEKLTHFSHLVFNMQLKLTDLPVLFYIILHNHSADDKSISKHFAFKAKFAFLFVYFDWVHRPRALRAKAHKHYQKANWKTFLKQQTGNGKQETPWGRDRLKWTPSCRTLNENEQWLMQEGNR